MTERVGEKEANAESECAACEGSGSAYIGCGSPLGEDCPECAGTGVAA